MEKLLKFPPFVGVVLGVFCWELGTTSLYLYEAFGLPTLLRVSGLFLILYSAFRSSYKRLDINISSCYQLLAFWVFLVALRGVFIGNLRPESTSFADGIRFAFIGEYGEITYLAPLLALMAARLESLYYLKKIALVFCVLFFLLTILYRDQIMFGMVAQGRSEMLDYTGGELTVRRIIKAVSPGFSLCIFMSFCYNYINSKAKILLPSSLILLFLGNAIGGSRGATTFSLIYFILFIYIVLKYPIKKDVGKKGNRSNSMLRITLFGLIIVAGVWGIIYLYEQTQVFDVLLNHAFGGREIDSGSWNNNRETITKDFFADFNSDFLSWIWGRGANGAFHTYYDFSGGHRLYMEWGFLYLVLKGGIVYLFLYVFCLLHGAYVGYYRSKNAFSKALSFMCLILAMNLISTGAEPQYSMLYVLSWMCFGLVERKEVRYISDKEIYNYFSVKDYRRGEKKVVNTITIGHSI